MISQCLSPETARGRDRRVCGRLRTEELETDLGRVVNLSASGMALLCQRSLDERVGETVNVTLGAFDEQAALRATIIWTHRAGFRKHLVGLRFVDLTDEDRARLSEIAQTAVFLPGLGNQYAAGSDREEG